MADLKQAHEKERLELVASVKEERERLQREREDLAKEHECLNAERVALEAEKKTILETRSIPSSQPKNPRTTTLAPKPPAAATRASTRKQGKRAASPPAPSAPPPPKRKRVTSPHPPATLVTLRSLAPRPDAHVLTNLQVEAMYQFCSTPALADTMAIRAEQRVTTPAHLRTLVESYVAENGTFPDIEAVAPQFAHLFRLSSSSQPPSHAGPSTFPDA
ncbi:hypothetical protein B0H11DRAFT_867489 [Mycena galericulata]|nr:hypothetical protein B0H11DRAFT_867489 [Mycena galericulata]